MFVATPSMRNSLSALDVRATASAKFADGELPTTFASSESNEGLVV